MSFGGKKIFVSACISKSILPTLCYSAKIFQLFTIIFFALSAAGRELNGKIMKQ